MPRSLLALLGAIAVASAATACDGKEATRTTSTTTTTEASAAAVIDFAVAGIEANGTPPPSDDVIAGVKATMTRYADGAVVIPLQTGAAAPDLGDIFTAGAAARLAAEDRETLVDEALPRFRRVDPQAVSMTLSTLGAPGGQAEVVAVRLDLQVRATRKGESVHVVHHGDFVLVPEASGWKIDSYQARTSRDTLPPTTTTTAAKKKGDDE